VGGGTYYDNGLDCPNQQRKSILSSMSVGNLTGGKKEILRCEDKREFINTRRSSISTMTACQLVPQELRRTFAKNPTGIGQSSYHSSKANEEVASQKKIINLELMQAQGHGTKRVASAGNIDILPKGGLLPINPRSQKQEMSIRDRSIRILQNISQDFTPGKMPHHIEKSVIARLKGIALEKGKEGCWQESYSILKKVLEFQEPNHGREHPEVADTMHCIGVALNKLGCVEDALIQLNEALYLKLKLLRKNDIDVAANMDVAATHHIIGSIYCNIRDFDYAIYHLKLARDIEIKNLGCENVNTAEMLKKFEQSNKFT